MRILLASSEVHPFSKTGGLADMTGALSKSLARRGHEVSVVTPLYRGILERFPEIKPFDWKFDFPLGSKRVAGSARLLEFESGFPVRRTLLRQTRAKPVTVYFVEQPEFFDRDSIYQDHGVDHPDNAQRFIFFSKCVANLARYLPSRPELVHVHDWQTGLVPLLVHHARLAEGWGTAPHTCLTIHNLAYQGFFPAADYDLANLPPEYFAPEGVEFHGGMNCLKAGINYADMITTVSPRYAREITTEQYGCGLDAVLRRRLELLSGILNGVDYDEWKTVGNPHLKHSYCAEDLTGKALNKAELQAEMGLRVRPEVPLFGTISRLADQKGIDIALGALEEMLATDMQFVLLGSGAPHFEKAFRKLARRHSAKAAVRIGFDQGLSHRIEAGCDFFLMPSRFEPCGLNQMYSLRYGTVPIVRITGGLDDTVLDITEEPDAPNGIKFKEYSVRALSKAIRKALVLYQAPEWLAHYRRNGMTLDLSWNKTAAAYELFYRRSMR